MVTDNADSRAAGCNQADPVMTVDRLSLAFGALADPTRRALLAHLAAAGEATVGQLAEPFAMSAPAISKHLKVLERAGLVEAGRLAQSRPRRLVAQPLHDATLWLEHYRPFWEAKLDRLAQYVDELKAERARERVKAQRQRTKTGARRTHLSKRPPK
jgi:DNA-binding transcriptional ArsR family regulator